MKNLKYTIVIEKSKTGFGAYVPDLPGCVAVAKTKQEVKELIKDGIEFHLEGMKLNGYKIPNPNSEIMEVVVKVA
ncbi:MAG: type II toxin-antitoxin system HicB family antitoxin [Ignavibacteria bacterium]